MSDYFTLRQILTDVLHRISWFHPTQIMLRDIRCDNIIVVLEADVFGSRPSLRGKIIDFGG